MTACSDVVYIPVVPLFLSAFTSNVVSEGSSALLTIVYI
jgi:hypothetical protein